MKGPGAAGRAQRVTSLVRLAQPLQSGEDLLGLFLVALADDLGGVRLHGSVREIALEDVRADGARLPVLVNSVLERDADGAPLAIRTAVFDATERRRYEQELVRAKERAEASEANARLLAATLQRTLIPPEAPRIEGLDVAAAYRPAGDGSEVGGDFYDVFQIGVDDWAIVVGDVCGKGAEAAVTNSDPGRPLLLLNDVLLRRENSLFCTASGRPRSRVEGTPSRCSFEMAQLARSDDREPWWVSWHHRTSMRSSLPWPWATCWCSTRTASPRAGRAIASSSEAGASSRWSAGRATPSQRSPPFSARRSISSRGSLRTTS